jgi:hypothetical protein
MKSTYSELTHSKVTVLQTKIKADSRDAFSIVVQTQNKMFPLLWIEKSASAAFNILQHALSPAD